MDYNASSESLRCEAPRWFPQPTVAWASQIDQGANFSEVSNTSFELNSENVTMKVVSVLYNVTINNTYSCMIENSIAKATGDIKVTGGFPEASCPPPPRAAGDETQDLGVLVKHSVPKACLPMFFTCIIREKIICQLNMSIYLMCTRTRESLVFQIL